MTASLRYSQAKLIQTLGRASQGVDAGVSASRVTTLRRLQERATKPLLNQRQRSEASYLGCGEKETGLLLSGLKSSFQMKVNFAFLEIKVPESGGSGEAQIPCCLKSSVKFPQSVMIWAAMSSAGVGPLFSEVHSQHSHLPGNFRALHASFADKLYRDADFIFQQDLALAHTAKGTKSWFNDHGVTVLDWPANSPDLNPIENLCGIVKRKMRDTRPNNADDLKAIVKETWASVPPQQCHKLITSMPRRIEAVLKQKEPLPN